MGPKKKNRGGRDAAPTNRTQKTGDTRQGDDVISTSSESPPNSDIMEEVGRRRTVDDDIVKVDLGFELETSVDVEKAEISGNDTKPGKGLHAIASISKSSKCKLTNTNCENFPVSGEGGNNKGKGDSDKFSHSCYWKLKSEELANQKLDLEKKTWELEADLAYWKGKAKELERNFLEVGTGPVPVGGRGSQSSASNCFSTTDQTTSSSRTSGKSGFFPTCPNPSMDKSSKKTKTGRKNANSRFRNSRADREMEVDENSSDSVEFEMTSRDPKRGVVGTTAASSKSYKLKVKKSKNLARNGVFNNEVQGTLIVNPLLDEYIMEHVLQYVMRQPDKKDVLNDIKNVRQVCKLWRNAATRLYRKTAPVMKLSSYEKRSGVCTFGKLKKFLDTMRDSEMIPFQSYEIKGSIHTCENQKLLEDFLRICGAEMVSVDFHFKKSETIQKKLYENRSPGLELPKLKTLLVDVDTDHDVYYTSNAHQPVYFTAFVLNATQSLREFRLKFKLSKYVRIPEYNLRPLQKFEVTISQAIPKSVKVLDLQMILTHRIFTGLTEKGLSLEEFAVDPSHVTGASEAIHCFIKNQSSHLKVLRIVGSRWKNDNLILEFPRLAKLETLKLADIYVKSVSIAEKFPNLTCLDVVPWEASKTFSEFLECAKKPVLSVKKISLPLSFAATIPFAEQISEYFPNITELRLHQGDRCIFGYFEEVFTHLCNLEELHISVTPSSISAIDLDAVLSGISKTTCTRVRNAREFDGVRLAGLQRWESMLNMNRLRKLVLEQGQGQSKSHHQPVMLTDFSIHFIFLELAGLEELRISGFSNKSMVRPVYLQRLKAKLHLTWESE